MFYCSSRQGCIQVCQVLRLPPGVYTGAIYIPDNLTTARLLQLLALQSAADIPEPAFWLQRRELTVQGLLRS